MRRLMGLVLVGIVATAAVATGQTRYNPQWIEFSSVDHPSVVRYVVQAFAEPTDLSGPPVATWSVPASQVVPVPATDPPRYRIAFEALAQQLPSGRSYRYRLQAFDAEGRAEDPSGLAPEEVRWSICVVDGVVQPLAIALGDLPALRVGQTAALEVEVTAPRPVYIVTIDLVSDGQPAFYFAGTTDLRPRRPYTLGPFPAPVVSSFLTVEATDERRCRAQLTAPALVSVVQ